MIVESFFFHSVFVKQAFLFLFNTAFCSGMSGTVGLVLNVLFLYSVHLPQKTKELINIESYPSTNSPTAGPNSIGGWTS